MFEVRVGRSSHKGLNKDDQDRNAATLKEGRRLLVGPGWSVATASPATTAVSDMNLPSRVLAKQQERALKHIQVLRAAGFIAGARGPAFAADISGAGATFPYPIYAKWADAYKKETGIGMNYQSIGSGGGIKQIQARTVTFGASDMPLSKAELDKDGLAQFPTVMGGVVPVARIEGVKPGDLTLDADVGEPALQRHPRRPQDLGDRVDAGRDRRRLRRRGRRWTRQQ